MLFPCSRQRLCNMVQHGFLGLIPVFAHEKNADSCVGFPCFECSAHAKPDGTRVWRGREDVGGVDVWLVSDFSAILTQRGYWIDEILSAACSGLVDIVDAV